MTSKQPELPLESAPAAKHLPEANEFSPGQLKAGLRALLVAIDDGHGDPRQVKELVRQRFYDKAASKRKDPEERLEQQRKRAGNAILGARKYGLVDDDLNLTGIGREIVKCETDAERHELLARHIIREVHGLEVLTAIREMQAAGSKVTKLPLQVYLEQMGFKLPRAALNHQRLLSWLRLTDVLPKRGYEISSEAVERIAGISLDAADAWSTLTDEQQAFLRVLRKIALTEGTAPVIAKRVLDAVEVEYGPIFKRPDRLAATLFNPLADPDAGWLIRSGVSKSGRGGKSGKVAATEKLLKTDVDLLPSGEGLGIPADLRVHLHTPLEEVYADLKSSNKHRKGIALELLAVRMAIDLSLTPMRLRERGASTGGAEVDLIADGAHLHFSRWLLQCKNTKTVSVAALAKEVGMATLLKASVIVLVTTGRIPKSVETFASELATSTPMQAVLVDGKLLERYRKHGADVLLKHFSQAARDSLALKLPQVISEVSEA
jgi:site-specific DNA-methyltransferase (cytosine-N4-specific)